MAQILVHVVMLVLHFLGPDKLGGNMWLPLTFG